jgi:response regulator RpfG family c-di-GMP phosphodiesterase
MSFSVLLVEDSPTQALRTQLSLQQHGVTVTVAGDGKKALEMARSRPPDLILSDVLMPGMDGFQLVLEVRQDPVLRTVPLVLYTASFAREEDRDFALRLGADGYVEKSLTPADLFAALRDAISRRRTSVHEEPDLDLLDERSFRGEYGEILATRLIGEAAKLERANEALAATYEATLEALVGALDLRDTETQFHSWRVTEYSLMIASSMGLNGAFLTDLERGSLLHDIGKIGVPDHILRKPGPLDEAEWIEMRKHPEFGYNMISHIEFLEGAAEVILAHHERWDGGGYPRGLAGDAIPLSARIFAIADALDAITSDRPYRSAASFETAIAEVTSKRGSQFDPTVVEHALQITPTRWREARAAVEERRRRRKAQLPL